VSRHGRRIGIYFRWLSGMAGGAERTSAILAAALAGEHTVELVHHAPAPLLSGLVEATGVELAGVSERSVPWVDARQAQGAGGLGSWRALAALDAPLSAGYDVFVALVHEVPPFCHARVGVLRVLFPFEPKRAQWPWNGSREWGLLGRVTWQLRLLYHDWGWRRRMGGYQIKLANSRFTRDWTRRLWEVDCDVVYPPVDGRFAVTPKNRTVLSVGRFAAEGVFKGQEVMARAFRRMMPWVSGWTYVTAGAVRDDAEREVFARVQAVARGAPIEAFANLAHVELRALYERASIFWHAAGLDHDEAATPWRSEHFGAVTVEAMAAGCVPVVIRKGGQPEIVEHGVSGFLWDTLDELEAYTLALMRDERLRARMGAAARARAREFSREAFCESVMARLARYL
jgi:glycosyltransferase involved in cell wall biosynthesis